MKGPDGKAYRIGHLYEQTGSAPAGKYLIDDAGAIAFLIDPGIGGRETRGADGREVEKLDSPKSQIMSLVVDGILTQKLPWGLIMIGVFLAVALEILGLPSSRSRWGRTSRSRPPRRCSWGGSSAGSSTASWPPRRARGRRPTAAPASSSRRGSSPAERSWGFLAALAARRLDGAFNLKEAMGALGENSLFAMVMYVALVAVPLYLVARRRQP